jgi:hypothetical protein
MKEETLKKYEAFALAFVRDPQQEAGALYRRIVNPKLSKSSSNIAAAEWMKPHHTVAKRIAELQSDIRARAEAINEEAKANGTLPVFLSVEEKRRYLADLVRFEPANYDPDKHAHIPNGIKKTQFGTNLEIPSKLQAIALDNDLSGDGAQAKGGNSVGDALLALVSKLRK